MYLQTANKIAYLQGEGAKREEWGVRTDTTYFLDISSKTKPPSKGKYNMFVDVNSKIKGMT